MQDSILTENLLSKRLLRLVAVLYNLRKGISVDIIKSQLNLDKATSRTDEFCNETCDSE